MRLLLDTHVLLWWHDQPARLTETAYDAITDLGNDVFISVVNGWEMQIKAQPGKLTLPKPLHDFKLRLHIAKHGAILAHRFQSSPEFVGCDV